MTYYRGLPSLDPRYVIDVGYDPESNTYWYQVFEDRQIISARPPGEDLKSLIDLVRATWGYVDWPEATDMARTLRDDAAWVTHAKSGDPATRYLARVLA